MGRIDLTGPGGEHLTLELSPATARLFRPESGDERPNRVGQLWVAGAESREAYDLFHTAFDGLKIQTDSDEGLGIVRAVRAELGLQTPYSQEALNRYQQAVEAFSELTVKLRQYMQSALQSLDVTYWDYLELKVEELETMRQRMLAEVPGLKLESADPAYNELLGWCCNHKAIGAPALTRATATKTRTVLSTN